MSAKRVAVQAALAKWMEDRLKIVRKELATEAKDAMDAGDRKKAVLDDGTVIGSVSISDPKWLPKVVNMEALFEWVEKNAPHNIETPPAPEPRVRPAYVEALLKSAVYVATAGVAIHPDTGEVLPGIEFQRRSSNATVTITDDQSEAIQAALADGRLDAALNSLTHDVEPKELER